MLQLGMLVSTQPYCKLHKKFVLAILSEDFIVSDLGLSVVLALREEHKDS
jgi:hypothetical protein